MQTPIDIRIVGNLSQTDWTANGITLAAAIVGALIGAGISWLVASQTAKEARLTTEKARIEDEKISSFRVGLKLMEITNSVSGYHHTAETQIAQTKEQPANAYFETWQVMKGFTGRPAEIHIHENDLIAF